MIFDSGFLDAFGDAVLVHDTENRIVAANAAASRLLGLPREAMLKLTPEQLSFEDPEHTPELAYGHLDRARQAGRYTFEWCARRPSGEYFWVEVQLSAIPNQPGYVLAVVRDITPGKVLDHKLKLAEQQYALMVKSLPNCAVVLYDHDLRFILADGPEVQNAGFTKKQLEGKLLREAVPVEFADLLEPRMTVGLSAPVEPTNLQYKDLWHRYYFAPVRDQAGEVVCGMLLAVNVTEQKKAEDALRQQQLRLRALTEHSPALIVEADPEGRILYVNRTRTGDPEKVKGSRLDSWAAPEHRDYFRRQWARVLAGEVVQVELSAYGAAGERIDYTAVMAPVMLPEGQVNVALTALDVTDKNRLSQAAQSSQERLAAVASQIPGFLFQLHQAPNGQITFPFVSPRVEEYYGYGPEQLSVSAELLLTRVYPDDQGLFLSSLPALDTPEPPLWRTVHRVQTPSRGLCWMEMTAIARPAPLGGVFWYGYALDITERKKMEAERERLIGELQARNAEMEQFTYTVSHDLKSPLVTIRGFLGMAEQDLADGRPDRLQGDLSRIGSAAEKMARLLNDLLELSRVGRICHPVEHLNLGEVVKEALELLDGPLVAQGVKVTQPDVWPKVVGDRVRLVQVFQNILENGIKYRGSARPTLAIVVEVQDKKVQVRITDNGIGIDPRYVERVFGLFEKLNPGAEGTGVGLALVRRIVEHHGGRVWAESAGLGQGTTFVLTLSRAPGD